MSLKIPLAHDFICPWCWVALIQTIRLKQEFDVEFEWLGYELFPEELEWPDPAPSIPPPANKPSTPSRFEFILLADDITLPQVDRPKKMRTFYAHQAVEYAKTEGVGNELNERLYRAFWERGRNINDLSVLLEEGQGIIQDVQAYEKAIRDRVFKDNIVGFDDPAYEKGVYNVPTYFIGDERLAEQPYVVLRKAIQKALG